MKKKNHFVVRSRIFFCIFGLGSVILNGVNYYYYGNKWIFWLSLVLIFFGVITALFAEKSSEMEAKGQHLIIKDLKPGSRIHVLKGFYVGKEDPINKPFNCYAVRLEDNSVVMLERNGGLENRIYIVTTDHQLHMG